GDTGARRELARAEDQRVLLAAGNSAVVGGRAALLADGVARGALAVVPGDLGGDLGQVCEVGDELAAATGNRRVRARTHDARRRLLHVVTFERRLRAGDLWYRSHGRAGRDGEQRARDH